MKVKILNFPLENNSQTLAAEILIIAADWLASRSSNSSTDKFSKESPFNLNKIGLEMISSNLKTGFTSLS